MTRRLSIWALGNCDAPFYWHVIDPMIIRLLDYLIKSLTFNRKCI